MRTCPRTILAVVAIGATLAPGPASARYCSAIGSAGLTLPYQVEELRDCTKKLDEMLSLAAAIMENMCASLRVHQAEINALTSEIRAIRREAQLPPSDLERSRGAELCGQGFHLLR